MPSIPWQLSGTKCPQENAPSWRHQSRSHPPPIIGVYDTFMQLGCFFPYLCVYDNIMPFLLLFFVKEHSQITPSKIWQILTPAPSPHVNFCHLFSYPLSPPKLTSSFQCDIILVLKITISLRYG